MGKCEGKEIRPLWDWDYKRQPLGLEEPWNTTPSPVICVQPRLCTYFQTVLSKPSSPTWRQCSVEDGNQAWYGLGYKVVYNQKRSSLQKWIITCFQTPLSKGKPRSVGCKGRCQREQWLHRNILWFFYLAWEIQTTIARVQLTDRRKYSNISK